MDDVIITFIGTGSAIPNPGRFQSCVALRHPHGLVIFDVGEGSQYNIRKYKISLRKELTIAISHMHSDHFQGIGGLLASLKLFQREEPINILTPLGGSIYIKMLLDSLAVNLSFPINWVEMSPGSVFNGKNYKILACRALHFRNSLSYLWKEDDRPGKWNKQFLEKYDIPTKLRVKIARGEKITFAERSIHPSDIISEPRKGRLIAYSGDTKFNPQFANFVKGCDVLIHEATYPSSMTQDATSREHSTVIDAAKIGKLAEAKIVMLTHIGSRVTNLKKEQKILQQYTNGLIAKDGFQYVVPFKN